MCEGRRPADASRAGWEAVVDAQLAEALAKLEQAWAWARDAELQRPRAGRRHSLLVLVLICPCGSRSTTLSKCRSCHRAALLITC